MGKYVYEVLQPGSASWRPSLVARFKLDDEQYRLLASGGTVQLPDRTQLRKIAKRPSPSKPRKEVT